MPPPVCVSNVITTVCLYIIVLAIGQQWGITTAGICKNVDWLFHSDGGSCGEYHIEIAKLLLMKVSVQLIRKVDCYQQLGDLWYLHEIS